MSYFQKAKAKGLRLKEVKEIQRLNEMLHWILYWGGKEPGRHWIDKTEKNGGDDIKG